MFSELINSQPLWVCAEDLHKIKPANIPVVLGRCSKALPLVKDLLQLITVGERRIVFFSGVVCGLLPWFSRWSYTHAHRIELVEISHLCE